MKYISKPFEQSTLQEIKTIPSLNTVHSLLPQAPATIVKVEAAYNGGQEGNAVEGYTVVGYKQVADKHFKSQAAPRPKKEDGIKRLPWKSITTLDFLGGSFSRRSYWCFCI